MRSATEAAPVANGALQVVNFTDIFGAARCVNGTLRKTRNASSAARKMLMPRNDLLVMNAVAYTPCCN